MKLRFRPAFSPFSRSRSFRRRRPRATHCSRYMRRCDSTTASARSTKGFEPVDKQEQRGPRNRHPATGRRDRTRDRSTLLRTRPRWRFRSGQHRLRQLEHGSQHRLTLEGRAVLGQFPPVLRRRHGRRGSSTRSTRRTASRKTVGDPSVSPTRGSSGRSTTRSRSPRISVARVHRALPRNRPARSELTDADYGQWVFSVGWTF
jgi:hypothetical protein